jgi:hypothetical protein
VGQVTGYILQKRGSILVTKILTTFRHLWFCLYGLWLSSHQAEGLHLLRYRHQSWKSYGDKADGFVKPLSARLYSSPQIKLSQRWCSSQIIFRAQIISCCRYTQCEIAQTLDRIELGLLSILVRIKNQWSIHFQSSLVLVCGEQELPFIANWVLECFHSQLIRTVSKRDLHLWKHIYICSEDMYSALNCNNVAKHSEFYLGKLCFSATVIHNARCFKKNFAMVFEMLLRGECY